MNLTGQLLVAMPGMGDPRFDRTVILICSHDAEGAMGLVVNRGASDLRFADLLEQVGLPLPRAGAPSADMPVHAGGPVEMGRGFVLHSPDYEAPGGSLRVGPAFSMTTTRDVLEAIANGRGPHAVLITLGYSGWGAGQLEGEIAENGWLTVPADADLVFGLPDAQKWEAALGQLGIDALTLSAEAGRA